MSLEAKPAIEVIDVTKRYRYWSDKPSTVKDILISVMKGKFDFGKRVEFTSLRNLSFAVKKGEFIGIMGRNGAGKSTLLKLISGIYNPTSGAIKVDGRIASIIELGAGFHPDLSGYENIFLNAAILGASRKTALGALQSIIDFSELAEKIYMPVKNYSSGMLVRLAFSIVVHLPSEIILADEILAVGDAGFQEKCLAKIRYLHEEEGRTIILITHDPRAIEQNCSRCIIIDQQEKIFDGDSAEGVAVYKKLFGL